MDAGDTLGRSTTGLVAIQAGEVADSISERTPITLIPDEDPQARSAGQSPPIQTIKHQHSASCEAASLRDLRLLDTRTRDKDATCHQSDSHNSTSLQRSRMTASARPGSLITSSRMDSRTKPMHQQQIHSTDCRQAEQVIPARAASIVEHRTHVAHHHESRSYHTSHTSVIDSHPHTAATCARKPM